MDAPFDVLSIIPEDVLSAAGKGGFKPELAYTLYPEELVNVIRYTHQAVVVSRIAKERKKSTSYLEYKLHAKTPELDPETEEEAIQTAAYAIDALRLQIGSRKAKKLLQKDGISISPRPRRSRLAKKLFGRSKKAATKGVDAVIDTVWSGIETVLDSINPGR
jgi:hypothetical protein